MDRYLQPAILLFLGLSLVAVEDILPWPNIGFAAMVVYGVGAVWWAVVAARGARPLLRHGLLAWVPAIPPVAAYAWLFSRPDLDGPGGIAAIILMPLAAVVLLASAVAAMVLAMRKV